MSIFDNRMVWRERRQLKMLESFDSLVGLMWQLNIAKEHLTAQAINRDRAHEWFSKQMTRVIHNRYGDYDEL